MHAQDEVRFIIAQHADEITTTKGDITTIDVRKQLNEGVKRRVQPGRDLLDAVVEADARAIHDRGFLQHLLDTHVNFVAIQLKAPLCKRFGPGIVSAARGGRKNEDANFGHEATLRLPA